VFRDAAHVLTMMRSWGGVTRTRGHAQLELSVGEANLYAGGGYAVLDGENVTSNQEYEFGTGGSYPVWRGSQNDEVRLGMDVVYFGYQRNLDFFTLGQVVTSARSRTLQHSFPRSTRPRATI
jgi:hypothetical protein